MKVPFLQRLFRKHETAEGSGLETLVFSIFNAVLSFLRSVIIAAQYGATTLSDAYYASVNILNTPAGMISDSVTALVPPRYLDRKRTGREKDYLASYLSAAGICFLALTLIFLVFGSRISSIVLMGFQTDTIREVDRLILLSLPVVVITPINVILSYALQAEKIFIFGNAGSSLNTVLSLVLLLVLSGLGVKGIVVSTLVGAAVNLLVLLFAVARLRMLRGRISLRLGFSEMRAAIPLILGGVLGVAASYAEKYFTSFLDAGTMTVMNMSASLIGVARTLLVGALVSVYYPYISAAVVAEDREGLDGLLSNARKLVFGVFGLAIACMIGFSYPLFALVFGHGRFDPEAVASLSRLFGISTFGVLFAALGNYANYVFYSKGDTKRPLVISIVTNTIAGVGFQALLVKPFGALGLVGGIAIANMLGLVADSVVLKRVHGITILHARDYLLSALVFAVAMLSGLTGWQWWLMAMPILYYFAISLGVFKIDPRALVSIISRQKQVTAEDSEKGGASP
jgi:putative peptidoglycan lipid II flippase